jgi:putative membrane protein
MMYGWNGDWGTMLLAMALNAVIWIALIGLLIWGVSRLFTNRSSSSGPREFGPSAQEILRQRYARGEIDAATFEEMRRRLEESPMPTGLRS